MRQISQETQIIIMFNIILICFLLFLWFLLGYLLFIFQN